MRGANTQVRAGPGAAGGAHAVLAATPLHTGRGRVPPPRLPPLLKH